ELRRPGPPLPGSPRRQAKSGESTSSRLTHPIGRARPGKAGLAACWSVSIAQRHAQVPSLLEVLVDHRLGTRGDLADHGGRRAAAHDAADDGAEGLIAFPPRAEEVMVVGRVAVDVLEDLPHNLVGEAVVRAVDDPLLKRLVVLLQR